MYKVLWFLGIIFQLLGAEWILLFFWKDSAQELIEIIFRQRVDNDGGGPADESENEKKQISDEIKANRLASIFICVGYFISMFAEPPISLFERMICFGIAVIMSIGCFLVRTKMIKN